MKTKIAIFGLGRIGQIHLENLIVNPRYVKRFQELWVRLNISNDDFIRTTELRHTKKVQDMLTKLFNQNDIYLFGTLVQAEPFLMNDERIGVWGALLGKGIEELRVSDQRSQTESGTIVMRAKRNLDYGGWK